MQLIELLPEPAPGDPYAYQILRQYLLEAIPVVTSTVTPEVTKALWEALREINGEVHHIGSRIMELGATRNVR